MELNSFEAAAEAATAARIWGPSTANLVAPALGTRHLGSKANRSLCSARSDATASSRATSLWRCANGAACLPMVNLRAWARIEHGMAWTRLWQDQVRPGCSGSGRSGFPASRSARIPLNCRCAAEFGSSTRFYTDLVGCLQIVDSRNVVQMRLRICKSGRIDGT